MIALLLWGSAILLSCKDGKEVDAVDAETLITQQSDTLLMINTENGKKTYRFWTPLLERYELAKEPYMEFRHGINIETYRDTTEVIESTLVADYAIFWEKQKLWEAKGNVVAVNADGQILETQQLFWNQVTKKVYSNVDTKVTRQGDVIIGVGFESDEDFGDFTFRRPRGKVTMDTAPTQPGDSTSLDGTSAAPASTAVNAASVSRAPSAAPESQRRRGRIDVSRAPLSRKLSAETMERQQPLDTKGRAVEKEIDEQAAARRPVTSPPRQASANGAPEVTTERRP